MQIHFLFAAVFCAGIATARAQAPCLSAYDAAAIADWRAGHEAGYSAQSPVLNVESPFKMEVILHFYEPGSQRLFQSFRVPPSGTPMRGLRYQGKPFLPGTDWGVRLSKGGQTSCTRFLGSLVKPDANGDLQLNLNSFLQNGFLMGATAGIPKPQRPEAEDTPVDTVKVLPPEPAPAAQKKERDYEISVQNNTPWTLEVAYTVDLRGNGNEETHAGTKIPAGQKSLLFRSRIGAFCIRAEATDANGQRRSWGGDAEKILNGEKKKFKCRVLGPTQFTYTASFAAQN